MEMNDLAHVLRAAKAITGETVFTVIGSQAILAQHPDAPAAMKMSMEVDISPRDRPDLSGLIEGALGAESHFRATFGYHADGFGEETAILPRRWEDRAIVLEGHPLLDGAVAICPEIHDLCTPKLVASRERGRSWVEATVTAGLVLDDILNSCKCEARRQRHVRKSGSRTGANWLAGHPRPDPFGQNGSVAQLRKKAGIGH